MRLGPNRDSGRGLAYFLEPGSDADADSAFAESAGF
jgi:hypothetical protein